MNPTGQKLVFGLLLLLLFGLAYGLNYDRFYDQSEDPWGFPLRMQTGDIVRGPWRCNEQFAIMGQPEFYDAVILSANDFWRGTGYAPLFRGERPFLNAPVLPLPVRATWHRERALESGFYYEPGPDFYAKVIFEGTSMQVAWCGIGLPCTIPLYQTIALPETAVVFFDCAVRLNGSVSNVLMLAASGDIALEDNVLYASSDPQTGEPLADHPEKLALISESSIVILNTIENGRENSSRGGRYNPNQDQSSIAINALIFTLGSSFTFANQNDADSGYVCACNPDERGFVHLYGGTVERRRGYLHRSTQGGTGYLRDFHYDEQMRFWDTHVFAARENLFAPERLEFGTIVADSAVSRAVTFANDYVPLELDDIHILQPFMIAGLETGRHFAHDFEVWLVATDPGEYFDTLRIRNDYYGQEFLLPVHALVEGLAAGASPVLPRDLSLSVYPNPFNATATLRYSLSKAGPVRLSLFDLAGREVRQLVDATEAAGEHVARFDGTDLATGLYFATLRTEAGYRTVKVMLVK